MGYKYSDCHLEAGAHNALHIWHPTSHVTQNRCIDHRPSIPFNLIVKNYTRIRYNIKTSNWFWSWWWSVCAVDQTPQFGKKMLHLDLHLSYCSSIYVAVGEVIVPNRFHPYTIFTLHLPIWRGAHKNPVQWTHAHFAIVRLVAAALSSQIWDAVVGSTRSQSLYCHKK